MLAEITPTRRMHNLGSIEQIPIGEGRAFHIGDHTIAVFRPRASNVFATQATCPHKGGPLADGMIGAGKVLCPLHAYKFELATGQALGNDCPALKTFSVHLDQNDMIVINLK